MLMQRSRAERRGPVPLCTAQFTFERSWKGAFRGTCRFVSSEGAVGKDEVDLLAEQTMYDIHVFLLRIEICVKT